MQLHNSSGPWIWLAKLIPSSMGGLFVSVTVPDYVCKFKTHCQFGVFPVPLYICRRYYESRWHQVTLKPLIHSETNVCYSVVDLALVLLGSILTGREKNCLKYQPSSSNWHQSQAQTKNTQNYNKFNQSERNYYHSVAMGAYRRKVMSTSSIIHIVFEKTNIKDFVREI